MNKGLSPRAQKLLSVSAQGIAKKRGSGQLTPEHVLLGMISDADSLGFEILLYLNINILMLQLALEQAVPQGNALAPNQEAAPSRRLRTLIDIAAVESRIARKDYIGTEHLLLALLEQEDGVIPPLVERIGLKVSTLIQQVEDLLATYPRITGNAQISFSPEAQKIIAKAEKEVSALKDEYLSTEHLFLAIAQSDGRCGTLLKNNGITKDSILSALKAVRGNQRVTNQDPEAKCNLQINIVKI